jgi:hypothetical protein
VKRCDGGLRRQRFVTTQLVSLAVARPILHARYLDAEVLSIGECAPLARTGEAEEPEMVEAERLTWTGREDAGTLSALHSRSIPTIWIVSDPLPSEFAGPP